ncbi:hypothetical protein D3C84_1108960 [compost metagenome]
MPSKKAISEVIMIALASYDTASVIHTTTAKARIANTRWPATGRSAGIGSNSTPTRAAIPTSRPIGMRVPVV